MKFTKSNFLFKLLYVTIAVNWVIPKAGIKIMGIPEYISSKSAFLLNNDDNLTKNLSKKIEELLCNDAEITKMKNNIKVNQKYENIEEYYNEFYKIIDETY